MECWSSASNLYVIPPGTYLSVGNGALHLSQPQARHGALLPFDFLLHSLAEECCARAICVILSGTGADGSLGLKAVKEICGLVIGISQVVEWTPSGASIQEAWTPRKSCKVTAASEYHEKGDHATASKHADEAHAHSTKAHASSAAAHSKSKK